MGENRGRIKFQKIYFLSSLQNISEILSKVRGDYDLLIHRKSSLTSLSFKAHAFTRLISFCSSRTFSSGRVEPFATCSGESPISR